MRLLVIMDPVERIVPARDTSLALIRAAHAAGHEVHHCGAADVSLVRGTAWATTAAARPVAGHRHGLELDPPTAHPLAWFDAAFIRCDPPFDHDYLTLTLLLEHARDDLLVVNDPRGLRDANEHLYGLRFPDLGPPTVVTADQQRILAFADECDGVVVKPVDGHAGHGVVRLLPGDPNGRSLVETMTRAGRTAVVVQQYLPQVVDGDTRIVLLDGEPLGAILRVPAPDDFRATIARGDVLAADLTPADRAIVDALAPSLRRDGLWFVGIDVIDGHLSEVNVTSPTGLVQLADLTGDRPAEAVIAALARRAAASRPPTPEKVP